MIGAVFINENDEVMFSTPPQRSSGDKREEVVATLYADSAGSAPRDP